MQLKISRASGNYLVLNLPGAVLTRFSEPGPECQVDLRLGNGPEGDAQFRKFLAQVMDAEDQSPVPAVKTLRDLQRRVIELLDENEHLAEQVRQQGITLSQAAPTAVDELKPPTAEPAQYPGGVWVPNPGNIFHGKSLAWLQGFQACRMYRLDVLQCEESDSPAVPVEPGNPYHANKGGSADSFRSWECGWLECLEYSTSSMPDPAQYLEKAK